MTAADDDGAAALGAMRAALVRTWYPFFARFPRPTPVQAAAWAPLLAGRDALVCSPTASGKTEAVLAPLVERHLPAVRATKGAPADAETRTAETTPRILVVCPTRALVNDLVRRVTGPLDRLELRVHRRTGDHATLDRDRPPHVLVTTPESMDSLLVRHPAFLRDVRAVVLDELHILDGTPRGDHLRVLLSRLRALLAGRGGALQTVASSATLHAPAALAARYTIDAELVVVPGQRPFEAAFLPTPSPHAVLGLLARLYGEGGPKDQPKFSKILVFLDRRADVEHLASEAVADGRLGNRVYAHHGSLSRTERERVEERFLRDPSAVCFATMTLELGIDVGDVDLVVLVGPPPSVASFLQRIGRGNRRTDGTRVVGCYRDEGEHARFRHLAELAREGDLSAPPYVFRPSVLVQQAGSLLMQARDGWISADVLHARLPADLGARFPVPRLEELLQALLRGEWLAPGRPGRFKPGPKLVHAFEHRTLHANLPREPKAVEVLDATTGASLGHVMAAGRGERVAVGGRSREVVRTGEGRVYVQGRSGVAEAGSFAPRGRPILSLELARSLGAFLGVPDGVLPLVDIGGAFALFHFAGSLAGTLLARHLKKQLRWPVDGGSALALVLSAPPSLDPQPPILTKEGLAATALSIAPTLSRLALAGPYHEALPASWQLAFLDEVLPSATIARIWSSARITRYDEDHPLVEVLRDLVGVR